MGGLATIVLRDIHQPAAPGWWPPAPGWWLLAGLLLAGGIAAWAWHAWRKTRRRRIERLFDTTLAEAPDAATRLAAISELLRRAARRHERDADRLQGEAWLRCLDKGVQPPRFSGHLGDLLLDGSFRPDPDHAEVDAVARAARLRFVEWMEAR